MRTKVGIVKTVEVVVCSLFVIGMLLTMPAFASKKVALVIGNNQYDNVPDLKKAVSDAGTISGVLKRTGFEVIEGHNLNRRDINRKIQDFIRKVDPGDTAMFYYAGHGIEIAGRNYLLPIDVPAAQRGDEEFVQNESVSLDSVLNRMRNQHASLNIVVLDACRNNPFKQGNQRGVGSARGLAAVNPPQGTFIMYSADAGEAALDSLSDSDTNPNSVFTRVLAPMIEKPNINLVAMAREVRREVRQLADSVRHQQTPAYYDSVIGDFYFLNVEGKNGGSLAANTEQISTPSGPENTRDAMELAYWNEVKNSHNSGLLESYIRAYPKGKFVYLASVKIDALRQKTKAEKPAPIVVAGGMDIESLLKECEVHFAANRLTTGAEGNALDCYKEVLEIRRGHRQALAGLGKIADRYIEWARREVGRNNPVKARQYLGRLKTVNPEHLEVSKLENSIQKIEQQVATPGTSQQKVTSVEKSSGNVELKQSMTAIEPEMVHFPGGKFKMGCVSNKNCFKDETTNLFKKAHTVKVGAFYMAKTEVTQAQWESVMGHNPSKYKGADRPVERVSWNDVQEYINKLNELTGRQYRLPTEAEWEYAARGGGNRTQYPWGNEISSHQANYRGVASKTKSVGSYGNEGNGLFDTVGNVLEWTASCYVSSYNGSELKSQNLNDSCYLVIRGGSWSNGPVGVRSAARGGFDASSRVHDIGFRLSRTLGVESDTSRLEDKLGLALSPLNDKLRKQYGVNKDTQGVIITDVDPASETAARGVQVGDVIVKVGRKSVSSIDEIDELIKLALKGDKTVLLFLIEREGQVKFLALPIG